METIHTMGKNTDNTWMLSVQLCTPSSETPLSLLAIIGVRKVKKKKNINPINHLNI